MCRRYLGYERVDHARNSSGRGYFQAFFLVMIVLLGLLLQNGNSGDNRSPIIRELLSKSFSKNEKNAILLATNSGKNLNYKNRVLLHKTNEFTTLAQSNEVPETIIPEAPVHD